MRVTVVGAGIIGTTAAFRIKRRFPDLEITVLAEKFSPNTTSDIGKKAICLISPNYNGRANFIAPQLEII